jgi:hypothetical protein
MLEEKAMFNLIAITTLQTCIRTSHHSPLICMFNAFMYQIKSKINAFKETKFTIKNYMNSNENKSVPKGQEPRSWS